MGQFLVNDAWMIEERAVVVDGSREGFTAGQGWGSSMPASVCAALSIRPRASGHLKLKRVRSYREHRAGYRTHDFFGHAAQEHMGQAASPMGAHDD